MSMMDMGGVLGATGGYGGMEGVLGYGGGLPGGVLGAANKHGEFNPDNPDTQWDMSKYDMARRGIKPEKNEPPPTTYPGGTNPLLTAIQNIAGSGSWGTDPSVLTNMGMLT